MIGPVLLTPADVYGGEADAGLVTCARYRMNVGVALRYQMCGTVHK